MSIPSNFKIQSLSLATLLTLTAITSGCASTTNSATTADTTTEMSAGELANANFKDKLTGKQLVKALQGGGYVVYFRHASTEKDYADQVTAEMGNCSTQRTLSENGWMEAISIGKGFKKYDIPYNQVISSQYCRAWQTAQLAFGDYNKNGDLNFPKSEDYSDAEIVQMKAKLDPMLLAVPPHGTNTVIVGHDDLFEASTGIYPDPQGIAYVVKPNGNGTFTVVANVLASEWPMLSDK